MTTITSTYERVSQITKVKDVFDAIKYGFDAEHETMKGFTAYSEVPETILEFVRDNSKGFQADIATKALKYGSLSEKQAWCVAFEFIKTKGEYNAWVNQIITNL